jgi:DNA-binding transcriptional regulator YdaS (Cro superfamily)
MGKEQHVRYVSKAEFARMMGVNPSTVNKWIKRGRLVVTDDGLIDAETGQAMVRRKESLAPHHQARKATFEMERGARQPQADESIDGRSEDALDATLGGAADKDDVAARYRAAMAREREAKAELAAMEVDRQAGLLLDRQEVDFVLADLGNTLRVKLEQAEDSLTEAVLPLRGDAAAIRHAVRETLREVLDDMSALMRRRMREVSDAVR